jgi:hypothetical protein
VYERQTHEEVQTENCTVVENKNDAGNTLEVTSGF